MHARRGWLGQSVAGALLGMIACGPALAGYDEGRAAYERGDYDTALLEWRPLAELGNAMAQKRLGDMYAGAKGVPEDEGTAIRWYGKAAEQGLASAQTSLGLIYESGRGVPQDYAMAVNYYRKAAALKDPVGQSSLAVMYEYGLGVPRNLVVAYALYNLSPLNRFYAQVLQGRMTGIQAKAGEELTSRLSQGAAFLQTLEAVGKQ